MIDDEVISIICLRCSHRSCQALLAIVALQRGVSVVHLEVIDPLVMCYVDFLRDEDLRKRGNHDGPEDGNRGANDCEINFDTRDGERGRIPPCEVHGHRVVESLSERGPEA